MQKPPEEVEGARQAWLVASALQALATLISAVMYVMDTGAVVAMVRGDGTGAMAEQLREMSDSQLIAAVYFAVAAGTIAYLLLVGLFVYLTGRMRRGGLVARFILQLGSIYLALQALTLVFGGPSLVSEKVPPLLMFSHGSITILSAVAAVAGLVLSSTKPATKYFENCNRDLLEDAEKRAAKSQRKRK